MNNLSHGNPPLSPVLLAGMALRSLPPVLLQPPLNAAMAITRRRHPGLFDRLAGLSGSTFLIDPIDLAFDFLLRPSPPPSLVAVAKGSQTETATATIRGPLMTLIQLLEGKLDGDALFFSRDLVVEGDTEAVVTLRNAVDGAGIDVLADFLSALGPFAGPGGRIAAAAAAVFSRMDRDLAILRRAVLAPLADRCEAQAAELRQLKEQVAELGVRRDARLHSRRARPTGTAGTAGK
ncbi:MAG TPA: lipid carrier protein [Alphaproteobacteria bacterium]|nr:lipid carrier protein [Alphaproteobacteria bacterium]